MRALLILVAAFAYGVALIAHSPLLTTCIMLVSCNN